jgi:nucleoredoxin
MSTKIRQEKLQRAAAENASLITMLGQGLLRSHEMCPTMDELVSGLHPKKVIGLYFSAKWSSSCLGFTPKLLDLYRHVNLGCSNAFEIVFVSHDRDLASFCAQLADMPWLALPYQDRVRSAAMTKRFSILSLPALVLLDANANIITRDGIRELALHPESFPWPQPQLVDLLGNVFVNKDGQSFNFEAALSNKIILLFFSARWADEAVEFTPLLHAVYNKMKKEQKQCQVLFVSCDQSQADFNLHMRDEMGDFLAVPFEDQHRLRELKAFFGLRNLPQLSLVGKDMVLIVQDAVHRVKKDSWGLDFPWGQPAAVSEVAHTAEGLTTEPCIILFCEQLEGDEKKALVKEFIQAAKAHVKKCLDKGTIQDIFYFTAAQESSTADQLRQYCRLKTGGPPTAVIIDVADNGASYPCHARVLTEETFTNFVQQWRDGKEHGARVQAD